MKPFLSVIIPVHNETKRLPLALVDLDNHLSRANYSSEIIVVDDGSTDATVEIVKHFSNLIKNLHLIHSKENQGQGWAVRQGMLGAKGNWRLLIGVDNSVSVDQFSKMLPYFSAGGGSAFGSQETYDIIIGSRDIKGAKNISALSWHRRLISRIGRWFIQMFLIKDIRDTTCSFKCFSEDAASQIFQAVKIKEWGFDTEALVLGQKFGYKVKEIPIVWGNDSLSIVSFKEFTSLLWGIIKIRWWLWRDKYPI